MNTQNEIEKKAIAEYETANANGKRLLERIYGTELFAGKVTDRIKKFEDAHPIFLKKKFKDQLFIILQKREVKELTAYDKLIIIAEVLRGDWKADYDNTDQWKYYPWFKKTAAGFGFSYSVFDDVRSTAHVGSRLCFQTEELAEYFGKQFIDLHNEFLIIQS